jgi:hypothetical protein
MCLAQYESTEITREAIFHFFYRLPRVTAATRGDAAIFARIRTEQHSLFLRNFAGRRGV